MTMGIVLVACLAARIAGMRSQDKDIDLELHEFGHKAWDTVRLSLNVAILNQDVFPLNVTEISQPLPECLDLRPGSVGIGRSVPTQILSAGLSFGCCAKATDPQKTNVKALGKDSHRF